MSGPVTKLKAMATASLLMIFTVPFAMGFFVQAIVPVIYTLAVIALIRLGYAVIRRNVRK